MWSIKNRTAYSVDSGWIRDINGAEVWIVAVKATYDLLPDGTTRLSAKQHPINVGSVPYPDSESLLFETDLGPPKLATDIVLIGHAWSPEGAPVTSLPIGMKVGSLTRLARVYGERIWDGEKYAHPLPFTDFPLRYEHMSAGSPIRDGYYNPVGIVQDEQPVKGISRLANIEFLTDDAASYDEQIGFGAIPCHWPVRIDHAGTYGDEWSTTRAPLLPADFNALYWQISPPAQQIKGRLEGNEVVTLANLLAPDFAASRVFSFTVPKLNLGFSTAFFDGDSMHHQASVHTLIIDTDRRQISVVWHSALPCHDKVNLLDVTELIDKEGVIPHSRPLPDSFPEWERL